ncbi:hypothetical protein Slin14017_G022910 [Septoria linicola]|nr:hypothetical protein Slin14017_G022910 [Septoria linicola]
MRFSLLTVGAFAAGSIAAPALSVEKRQIGNVLELVQGLYTQVTSLTGAINATVDTVADVDVAGVDLANITATIKTEISIIVETVSTVLKQTKDLTDLTNVGGVLNIVTGLTSGLPVAGSVTGLTKGLPVVGSLASRQASVDVSAVVHVVTNLLVEITGTVDNATKVVPGLKLGEIAEPLTTTLNNLLDDLENILEGVLKLVNGILKSLRIVNVLNLKLDI